MTTNSPTSTEQVIEQVIDEINRRFPNWQPTPSMLGYARAVARGTALALSRNTPADSEEPMVTDARQAHWTKWPNGDAGDALDYALDHIANPFERTDFLECWRYSGADNDGGLSEWPEYYRWLNAQREGALSAGKKGTDDA